MKDKYDVRKYHMCFSCYILHLRYASMNKQLVSINSVVQNYDVGRTTFTLVCQSIIPVIHAESCETNTVTITSMFAERREQSFLRDEREIGPCRIF